MTGTKLCIYKGGGQRGPAWHRTEGSIYNRQAVSLHLQRRRDRKRCPFRTKVLPAFRSSELSFSIFIYFRWKHKVCFLVLQAGGVWTQAAPAAGRHSPFLELFFSNIKKKILSLNLSGCHDKSAEAGRTDWTQRQKRGDMAAQQKGSLYKINTFRSKWRI